jgi:hypothetical protein
MISSFSAEMRLFYSESEKSTASIHGKAQEDCVGHQPEEKGVAGILFLSGAGRVYMPGSIYGKTM